MKRCENLWGPNEIKMLRELLGIVPWNITYIFLKGLYVIIIEHNGSKSVGLGSGPQNSCDFEVFFSTFTPQNDIQPHAFFAKEYFVLSSSVSEIF